MLKEDKGLKVLRVQETPQELKGLKEDKDSKVLRER